MNMHFSILLISMLLINGCTSRSEKIISADRIRCNGFENPVGTGNLPEFSWIIRSSSKAQVQSACQIIVGSDKKSVSINRGNIWDSGKMKSSESTCSYTGIELQPGKKYYWKVRVWNGDDIASDWSRAGEFSTGLFENKDWEGAKWIGYEDIPDSLLLVPGVHGAGNNLGAIAQKRMTVPYFRKNFSADKRIAHAFVSVCGLGQYELYINCKKSGDHFLSPGWSDYRKTCFYNTYDVTGDLKKGLNTIGAIVGNGFYNINRERYRKLVIAFGAPKMILKLDILYIDGTRELVTSDETWKTSPSPVVFSSIYGGEDYDARMEQPGWDRPDFNDSGWKNAIPVKEPAGKLKPENDNPLKVAEIFSNGKITIHNDSTSIFDFRQNASGIIKIRIKGPAGRSVRFIPGELLGEDSLVTQKATGDPYLFTYILKGSNDEIWTPRFTYYGFRYVQAVGAVPAGYPNPGNLPVIEDISFLHTRNSTPETGSFECSGKLFNSIYGLINWAIKSNLSSVSTDCPHREKLGWLEQAHLMGNSIKYIYDIHNLYNKIINDMMEAQLENGLVPDIAPEYVPFTAGFRDSPEWGSACVILPWYMYEWYGDIQAVKRAYPMMKRYVSYLGGMAKDHILSHGLGDWYDLGPRFPGEAQLTPKALTATSMYFYDVRLLAEMANLTGNMEDYRFYRELAESIRSSFNRKFFDPRNKVYSTGSQTAYSMPLFFGMVDDSCKNDVVKNLIRSIYQNNKALTAGDIGYRYLLRTLEQEGQSQLIFDMNSKTDVPGYGYQLSKGATSLTESWAALKYVSNNHMMLGHLMEWFFSGIGGIRQEEGSHSYTKLLIEPEPVGDLTWAKTTFCSVHGEVHTSWEIRDNSFNLMVRIPANCTAAVAIPQADPGKVFIDGKTVKDSPDVKNAEVRNGKTICRIGSGEYQFKTSAPDKNIRF
jgi:alpha-L-rhamnosidase